MSDFPESLATKRLTLMAPQLSDADAIFRNYAADPEVTKYLTWRPHRRPDDTVEFLRQALTKTEPDSGWVRCIRERTGKDVIRMIAGHPGLDAWGLGYVLGRQYWGRGYMTEVVKIVIDWWMHRPDIFRVWAICDVDNVASARVLAKVGMEREGCLRRWCVHPNLSEEPRDVFVYSIVRSAAT